MDETTHERTVENIMQFDISDEALEAAVCAGKGDTFTGWMCTALYFCPGP